MWITDLLRRAAWGLAIASAGMASVAEMVRAPLTPADLEFFEGKVRPVLIQYCHGCHGAEAQKGGLRLDHIDYVLTGGDSGPALVAGNPSESRISAAISYLNVDLQMPPKGILPDTAREALNEWIERGAPWPDEPLPEARGTMEAFDLAARRAEHWAWQPVTDPEAPTVRDSRFQGHPVDRFLQALREEKGLQTAPEADRRILARRANFALTGLPPTPASVDAFVHDSGPDAYGRFLDGLLDSPAFGERWARHWFDLVRYADTHGHEGDYPIRHSWTYRDYVIRALNDDVPYDEFVREHIAGDLLPAPRRNAEEGYNESVLATGFWYMHQATHAPVDVKRDQADRIDNQLDVLSKTFLGMTVSCSRCHDHKFDAISSQDYYALAGHLYSARQAIAFLDPGQKIQSATFTHQALLRKQLNTVREILANTTTIDDQPIAPYLLAAAKVLFDPPKPTDGVAPVAQSTSRDPRPETATGRPVEKVAAEMGLDPDRLARWAAALDEPGVSEAAHPLHTWRELSMEARRVNTRAFLERARVLDANNAPTPSAGGAYTVFADFDGGSFDGWFASGDAFGNAPTDAGAWHTRADEFAPVAAGVAHSGLVSGKLQGILRSPTFTIDCDFIHFRAAGQGARMRLVVDGYQLRFDNGLLFDDTLVEVGDTKGAFTWLTMGKQVGKYRGRQAYLEFIDEGDGYLAVDRVVFSTQPTPPTSGPVFHIDGLIPAELTHKSMLLTALATRYEEAIHTAWRNRAMSLPALAADPVTDLLLRRGLWWRDADRSLRDAMRTELAASAQAIRAPLKALAMENGTPQNAEFFIRGDHRNVAGEVPRGYLAALDTAQPTPTRLDLADRITDPRNPLTARVYVNRVWHHLFGRGIVASVDNFGVLGQRPTHPALLDHLANWFMENGWSTKRLIKYLMETETYRMSSVPSSPETESADPADFYLHRMRVQRLEGEIIRDSLLALAGNLDATMYGPSVPAYVPPFEANRRSPASGPMDGNRRRTIYLEVRRNHLLPMAAAFDMPVPDTTIGGRTVSNLPAQALILMNDPFVVRQAEVWSERLLAVKPADFTSLADQLFEAALARAPRADEQAALSDFMHSQAVLYGIAPENAWQDARVLADLCHTVFMLKEFIYIG